MVDRVRQMARTVRRSYVAERSAFETAVLGRPYRYTVPKRYDGLPPVETSEGTVLEPAVPPVWDTLARFFITREIDPLFYIATQFRETARGQPPPEPSGLLSRNAQSIWDGVVARKDHEVKLALRVQQDIARTQISFCQRAGAAKEDSFAQVIVDNTLELTPLFRYCLASSIGGLRFRRLAKRYEAEACTEYQRYRVYYQRHWDGFLPAGFDRLSRVVYQQQSSGG